MRWGGTGCASTSRTDRQFDGLERADLAGQEGFGRTESQMGEISFAPEKAERHLPMGVIPCLSRASTGCSCASRTLSPVEYPGPSSFAFVVVFLCTSTNPSSPSWQRSAEARQYLEYSRARTGEQTTRQSTQPGLVIPHGTSTAPSSLSHSLNCYILRIRLD